MSQLELPTSHPIVAFPGDDDLTFDISGLHISSWSECDGSFVIRLSDGLGWWDDGDGPTDIDHVDDAEILATIATDLTVEDASRSVRTIDWLRDAFTRWGDADLRMTAAPGRLARLAASDADWVCLPYQPYPDGGPP